MPLKKIRLLHLVKSLDLGGIEKSTIIYSNHLASEFDFIGIYASQGFYDDKAFISEKIHRFEPPYEVYLRRFFLHNLLHLIRVIRSKLITHVHYHHRIFIPFAFGLKIFSPSIKIIYTHHSIFNDSINRLIIADVVVALNKSAKNDLTQNLQKKTVIIPHGVSVKENITANFKIPKNIGFVGRFVHEKGILGLINSFKKVHERFTNAKLIFVGDGPLKNEMNKLILYLKFNDHIIYRKPSISEDEVYRDIDLLVLPSDKLEGFGLVIIEAMAKGIPVVVKNLDIYNEIVIDGSTGIISREKLFFDLISLFDNPELYNKIRIEGLLKVNKNYDIVKITKDYKNSIYV